MKVEFSQPEWEQRLSSKLNLTATDDKRMWISGRTFRSSFNCDSGERSKTVDGLHRRFREEDSPSRRSKRRTHSSVTGGSSFRRRQYSASLETDQTEKGNPRSEGLDNATSTNSRSCAALRMGARPLGFETCSKVANALLLKRWTQSYATVKWQPTRSAASSRLNPRWTWSMTRYR